MNLSRLPSTVSKPDVGIFSTGTFRDNVFVDWLKRLIGGNDWKGTDRRQSVRAACDFEVQVTGDRCSFWARAKDVSDQAIKVEALGVLPSGLRRGTRLMLKHLNPAFDCPRDTIQVRVLWARRKTHSCFQLALAFDKVETMRDGWVRNLLVRVLKKVPQQKRRHVRVRMDWMVPALVRGDVCKVRLRDLSMGGARLEMSREPRESERIALRVKDLKLPCEVRRVQRNGGTYLVGVRFPPEFNQSKKLLDVIKFVVNKKT